MPRHKSGQIRTAIDDTGLRFVFFSCFRNFWASVLHPIPYTPLYSQREGGTGKRASDVTVGATTEDGRWAVVPGGLAEPGRARRMVIETSVMATTRAVTSTRCARSDNAARASPGPQLSSAWSAFTDPLRPDPSPHAAGPGLVKLEGCPGPDDTKGNTHTRVGHVGCINRGSTWCRRSTSTAPSGQSPELIRTSQ